MIWFLLLVTATTLEIPITTNRSPSKAGFLLLVNDHVKYLELSLTGKSFIYADLNSSGLAANLSEQLKTKGGVEGITGTGIECPSKYCQVSEFQTISEGQSIVSKLNFQIEDRRLFDFPINAVYSAQQQQSIDGRINLFTLLYRLKLKKHIPEGNFTLLFNHQHQQIIFGEKHNLTQITRAPLKPQSLDTVLTAGFQIGKSLLNFTQLVLSLSIDGLHFPKSQSDLILKTLNNSNIDCQWDSDNNLSCIFSAHYPQFQVVFENNSLIIPQQSLIKTCYLSRKKKSVVCDFDISLSDEDLLVGGLKFLQRFPMTLSENIIFYNPQKAPSSVGMTDLFLRSIFGWSTTELILLGVFSFILVILKGYHLYFQCLPASAYLKYGGLVSTSTSSIQSENSERDIHEIDTVKEMQNV